MESPSKDLMSRLNLIYAYGNPDDFPEFKQLNGDESAETLQSILNSQILRLKKKEEQKRDVDLLTAINYLLELVESEKGQGGLFCLLLLRGIQETIRGHVETLSLLESPNNLETQCLHLGQEILEASPSNPKVMVPLFQQYTKILIDHNDLIALPAYFDPCGLIWDMLDRPSIEKEEINPCCLM